MQVSPASPPLCSGPVLIIDNIRKEDSQLASEMQNYRCACATFAVALFISVSKERWKFDVRDCDKHIFSQLLEREYADLHSSECQARIVLLLAVRLPRPDAEDCLFSAFGDRTIGNGSALWS